MDAKRLLDDLISGYNNVVRPVSDPTDKIILKLGLKLSQIADIVGNMVVYFWILQSLFFK